MKALFYTRYGSPEVLKYIEVEKPVPAEDEVLIKVQAASINSWDRDLVSGKPYLYRLISGTIKPKHKIIGSDVAGVVEECGNNIQKLKPGDKVFGDISSTGFGSFAEYVCTKEKFLAIKPEAVSYEDIAAVPQAASLALQGLRLHGDIKPGQKVLINGAGGGVGTFAIQMAKYWGAEVTGVDSQEKLEMIRSLGADYAIDYNVENFTKAGKKYDLILDAVAGHSMFDYIRSLNKGGAFIMVGGAISLIFGILFFSKLIKRKNQKKMNLLLYKPNSNDLDFLKDLILNGNMKPVIDKVFNLNEGKEALAYFGKGSFKGKVVIKI